MLSTYILYDGAGACKRFLIALERVRLCLTFKTLLKAISLSHDGSTGRWLALKDNDSERFIVARGGDGCHTERQFPRTVAAEIEAHRCLNTARDFSVKPYP
ncbi:MAG: hypothetical protein Ct9H300mP13_5750 [Gammaproteobacteria bacterium]|nr:MAG: hypothetical protein Ct9H300mP13_5750 [Gammaproteobacteria bacterium]